MLIFEALHPVGPEEIVANAHSYNTLMKKIVAKNHYFLFCSCKEMGADPDSLILLKKHKSVDLGAK